MNYAGGIDESYFGKGGGGALRFGMEADLVAVSLTGEVGLQYHDFGSANAPSRRGTSGNHYGAFVGGRLAFGKVFEPSILAHVGVGRLNVADVHDTGPEFDVGLALDLTVSPLVDVGIHAMYDFQQLDNGEKLDWYKVGAHAALVF